jgi:hypothetical protein
MAPGRLTKLLASGLCGCAIACNGDSGVKVGMSEAEVKRIVGKPSFQTINKSTFDSYLLPAACLPRVAKVILIEY